MAKKTNFASLSVYFVWQSEFRFVYTNFSSFSVHKFINFFFFKWLLSTTKYCNFVAKYSDVVIVIVIVIVVVCMARPVCVLCFVMIEQTLWINTKRQHFFLTCAILCKLSKRDRNTEWGIYMHLTLTCIRRNACCHHILNVLYSFCMIFIQIYVNIVCDAYFTSLVILASSLIDSQQTNSRAIFWQKKKRKFKQRWVSSHLVTFLLSLPLCFHRYTQSGK